MLRLVLRGNSQSGILAFIFSLLRCLEVITFYNMGINKEMNVNFFSKKIRTDLLNKEKNIGVHNF